MSVRYFFFNVTATTEIYTLSLHDALPISELLHGAHRAADAGVRARRAAFAEAVMDLVPVLPFGVREARRHAQLWADRKSTRLNSSHPSISYAVFCLKKKKKYLF